jgi:hypothetical protein
MGRPATSFSELSNSLDINFFSFQFLIHCFNLLFFRSRPLRTYLSDKRGIKGAIECRSAMPAPRLNPPRAIAPYDEYGSGLGRLKTKGRLPSTGSAPQELVTLSMTNSNHAIYSN